MKIRQGIVTNIDRSASERAFFNRVYSQLSCICSTQSFVDDWLLSTCYQTFGYVSGREKIGDERKSWAQLFKDNGYYTARVSKIYHMGIPIDIEKGSDGADDSASWIESFNSQAEEGQTPGEAELVQNNAYGMIEIKET